MLNVLRDSNDESNFLHKLLLTNTQVSRILKAFANGSLANIKFSKTNCFKMKQVGELFVSLLAFKVLASLATPPK